MNKLCLSFSALRDLSVSPRMNHFFYSLNSYYQVIAFTFAPKAIPPLMALFLFITTVESQVSGPPDPCDDGTQETCQCESAPVLCNVEDLDGFEFSMSTFQHPQDGPDPLCSPGGGIPNNPTWFAFIAWCEELTLEVGVDNCINSGPPFNTIGVQLAIYGDCEFNEQVACLVSTGQACGNEDDKTLIINGLNIGQTYYFLVDGCGGSACDISIAVIGDCGLDEIDPFVGDIDGPAEICVSTSDIFTVEQVNGAGEYNWFLDGEIIAITDDPELEIEWPEEGSFELCVQTSNDPCIPLSEAPQPICITVEVFYPLDDLGEFIVCEENLPISIEGMLYNEPGSFEIIEVVQDDCDIRKIFEVTVIENFPQDVDTVVCAESFPFFYPPSGFTITGTGAAFVEATDELGCDSSFFVNFYDMEIAISVTEDPPAIRCPSQIVLIDGFEVFISVNTPQQTTPDLVEYLWFQDGEELFGETSPTLEVFEEGEYTVIVTATYNGTVCQASQTFIIEEDLDEPDVPDLIIPQIVCTGEPQLATIGNYDSNFELIWTINGPSNIIADSVDGEVEILFDQAGEVEVCATFQVPGCVAINSDSCVTITVTEEIQPQFTGNLIFCEGDSTTINLVGDYEIVEWNGEVGGSSYTAFDSSIVINLAIIDSIGCSGDTTFQISMIGNPRPSISGDSLFCEEGFTELSVQDGFESISWNSGEEVSLIQVNEEGLYIVEVADENGCTGSDSLMVSVASELEVVIEGNLEICQGQMSELFTVPSTFSSFEWNNGGNADTISVQDGGIYSVIVGDGRGCFGFDTVELVVNPLPTGDFISEKDGLCPEDEISIEFSTNDPVTTFEWSTGSNQNTTSISQAGLYSITITDENSCLDSFDITLPEFPSPQPQITGDSEYCLGESTELMAGEDYETYEWSTGDTENNTTAFSPGWVFLEVTDENQCLGVDSIFIIENPLPIVEIVGDENICQGEETTLGTNLNFENYDWSTGETAAEISVSEEATYSVVVTDNNGCQNSAEFNMMVNPIPEIELIGSTTFCTGFSTQVTVEGFVEVLWSTGDEGPVLVISEEGNYSVTATDENGCTNDLDFFITEDEELQPTISGNPEICPEDNTVLNAGAGFETYEWSTGENSNSITVDQAGVYELTVTDAEGCSGSATFEVSVLESPSPSIQGVDRICFGSTETLEVEDNFDTYLWNDNSTESSLLIDQGGTYSVTVTDANSCSGETSVTVVQNPEIIPQIMGPSEICEGDDAQIEVPNIYDSYIWSTGSENNSTLVTEEGNYEIEVTDEFGCSGSAEFSIQVLPLPVINTGEELELNCLNQSVEVSGEVDGNAANFSFEWFAQDGTTKLADGESFTVEEEGVYVVSVTDLQSGCNSTAEAIVNRDPTDIAGIELLTNDPLCFGESNGVIEVVNIISGTSPFEIRLNDQLVANNIAANLSAGTYELEVFDDKGCELDTTVVLQSPPEVLVNLGDDIEMNFGSSITIEGEVSIDPERIDNIRWLIAENEICNPCDNLELLFADQPSSTVTLEVTDVNGCSDSDQIFVRVVINREVYIPNAFSPNDDGVNDRFLVFGTDVIEEVEQIRIFNRWGEQVFERSSFPLNGDQFGWDGTFKSEKLNPGVYVYYVRVRFIDGLVRELSGDLTLMR